jgi:hypothetical protein
MTTNPLINMKKGINKLDNKNSELENRGLKKLKEFLNFNKNSYSQSINLTTNLKLAISIKRMNRES